ncbi:hypothetical protein BN946_scf184272.g2 [Trametes cinnabarina]|uniref:Dihydrolipoamide acetyltransferase component of pyruvate dehydrogenase complex n=1 Tax=Pycnoporus cinnabarinus TaxID=5643 RepID=A0A060SR00_PYCCI|nr:hypothetical protein BN946_scf184272.g2 [Trametes cinnabarina]
MLSRRLILIARGRALAASRTDAAIMTKGWKVAGTYAQRSKFHSTNLLKAETVKVPQMAESISEGTLKSWLKKPGDVVQADEEVATIETDKIDVSVNAPAAGRITELLANEEDTVAVGQDLFRFEPGATDEVAPKEQKSSEEGKDLKETRDSSEPKDQQVEKGTPPPPSPTPEQVRKPDPAGVQGGTAKKEVKETSKPATAPAPKETKEQPASTPRVPGSRNETRVKMSRMRMRIAERLKDIMDMRKKYKEEVLKEHDVKLGYMSAFAKACCLALKEIPAANASIEGDEIVYRDYVDLSVAVATPKGLVTPVVRNAETMNFVEIEREIAALGKKARDGKLTLEDMAGGTFTISNGGVFGSLYGTPIINLPQSAVLGMHAIKDRPVVVDGQIVIRPIMVVALTYDHRLLDGREAVTFLVKVRDYIEDPRKMLLTA